MKARASFSYILLVTVGIAVNGCAVQPPPLPGEQEFTYSPAGQLSPPESGSGHYSSYVYAPAITFPIEHAPAYINSQVWGYGGANGPRGGGQCDDRNYAYPWHDNFCENRSWEMPLCPAGTGHQGVDIRPATCDKDLHWAVAVEDGVITSIGSYSIYLRGRDTGTVYRYLHLNMDKLPSYVRSGARIDRGQPIGLVSNHFGNSGRTTIHLHFDMKQTVRMADGSSRKLYVPPYTSLINAYMRLLDTY